MIWQKIRYSIQSGEHITDTAIRISFLRSQPLREVLPLIHDHASICNSLYVFLKPICNKASQFNWNRIANHLLEFTTRNLKVFKLKVLWECLNCCSLAGSQLRNAIHLIFGNCIIFMVIVSCWFWSIYPSNSRSNFVCTKNRTTAIRSGMTVICLNIKFDIVICKVICY